MNAKGNRAARRTTGDLTGAVFPDNGLSKSKRAITESRGGDSLPTDWKMQELRWDAYHLYRTAGPVLAFTFLTLSLAVRCTRPKAPGCTASSALKFLPDDVAKDPQALARFQA
jgi:hypothetical protein